MEERHVVTASTSKDDACNLSDGKDGCPSTLQIEEAISGLDECTDAHHESLVRQIDLRLILPTGILYFCCVLDRTNLSAAAIAGMAVELRLNHGFRYVRLVFSDTNQPWTVERLTDA
jgi:hypothetical protein